MENHGCITILPQQPRPKAQCVRYHRQTAATKSIPSAVLLFGLPSWYTSLPLAAGQQLCRPCRGAASFPERDRTARGETSAAVPRRATLPHESLPLVTVLQHKHHVFEQRRALLGTSCTLTSTKVLIKNLHFLLSFASLSAPVPACF